MLRQIASIITSSMAITAVAIPSGDTVIGRLTGESESITGLTRPVLESNPAAMYYYRSFSLTVIDAGAEHAEQDEAVITQTGDSYTACTVKAASYIRLDSLSAAYGDAAFTTGTRGNVKWNNCADYRRVAPYVTGDSVGGDITRRQYSFSGGYARRYRRLTWGVSAAYRAAMNHRSRDPRLKIIVSDLTAEAGVTLHLSESHAIGLSGRFNTYNQEADVEFYNPMNSIKVYILTGLGTVYTRFSGNSNSNTSYTGTEYGGSIQLLSTVPDGVSASVGYRHGNMRQLLRDLNNLDLTATATTAIELNAAAAKHIGILSGAITLNARMSETVGTENLFGTAAGNHYEKISSRNSYRHRQMSALTATPVSYRTAASGSSHAVTVTPCVTIDYSDESYAAPRRRLAAVTVGPGLTTGYTFTRRNKQMLRVTAAAMFATTHVSALQLDGLDKSSSLGATVMHDFDMLTANRNRGSVTLEWGAMINRDFALRIMAGANITHYARHGNTAALNVSAGIIF